MIWLFWAAALLLIPLDWLAAMAAAGAVHELGHWLAVRLLGGEVLSFRLALGGAVMESSPMAPGKALLCSLAGPLAGACLLLLYPCFPRLALCAGVQTLCNLLPVKPLDGGRMLEMVQVLIRGREAPWLDGALTAALAGGICWLAYSWGTGELLLLNLFLLREKYLANRRKKGYNSATIKKR